MPKISLSSQTEKGAQPIVLIVFLWIGAESKGIKASVDQNKYIPSVLVHLWDIDIQWVNSMMFSHVVKMVSQTIRGESWIKMQTIRLLRQL